MTKVTILGQSHEDVKPKKKIEFKHLLTNRMAIEPTDQEPANAIEVILIQKSYTRSGLDLMFAKYEDEDSNCIFLGHFNDGEV